MLRDYYQELEEYKETEKARNRGIKEWIAEMQNYAQKRNYNADNQTDSDLSAMVESVNIEQEGKFGSFTRYLALDKLYQRALETDINDSKILGFKNRRDQILEQLYPRTPLPKSPVWTGNVGPLFWRKTTEVYRTHSRDEVLKLRNKCNQIEDVKTKCDVLSLGVLRHDCTLDDARSLSCVKIDESPDRRTNKFIDMRSLLKMYNEDGISVIPRIPYQEKQMVLDTKSREFLEAYIRF